jgi:penicillin-insensitive murein endopeptidase
MLPEQWSLMKEAFQTGQTLIIFVDPVIKMALCYEAQQEGDLKNRSDRGAGYEVLRRIHTLSGHNTHFHLRIKCGNGDSRCRNQIWSYGDSGCFGGK